MKSLAPANIVSGFKTCGVYLFNPKLVRQVIVEEIYKLVHGPSSSIGNSLNTLNEFTAEEVSLCKEIQGRF